MNKTDFIEKCAIGLNQLMVSVLEPYHMLIFKRLISFA